MPYSRNEELPPAVRRSLPPDAQDIYRAAFNAAWWQRAQRGALEAALHRIAWGVVKRQYEKVDGIWLPRPGLPCSGLPCTGLPGSAGSRRPPRSLPA